MQTARQCNPGSWALWPLLVLLATVCLASTPPAAAAGGYQGGELGRAAHVRYPTPPCAK